MQTKKSETSGKFLLMRFHATISKTIFAKVPKNAQCSKNSNLSLHIKFRENRIISWRVISIIRTLENICLHSTGKNPGSPRQFKSYSYYLLGSLNFLLGSAANSMPHSTHCVAQSLCRCPVFIVKYLTKALLLCCWAVWCGRTNISNDRMIENCL